MAASLSDGQLDKLSLCGLYDFDELDPLAWPAKQTFRWALRQRHNGQVVTPEYLRERFVSAWQEGWTKSVKDESYWAGPKAAGNFGRRVYEFLLNYEVAHPFEPYTLDLPSGQVHGENAVVWWAKARQEPVPMVVDLRLRRPRDLRVPYYPALAQWLAARQDIDTVELGILHLPLIWGEPWRTSEVNEALAHQWLDAIVNEAGRPVVLPRPGSHCVDCSHPCKEIFRGPDDDRRN